MRILLLATVFPTPAARTAGSYNTERVLAHRAAGRTVTALAPVHRYGPLATALGTALGRSPARVAAGSVFRPVATSVGPLEYAALRRERAPQALVRRTARDIRDAVGTDFDVVHAHGMYVPAAGLVAEELNRLTGIPYVVTLHGSDVHVHMPRDRDRYARALTRARAVVSVSTALKERAIALGAPRAGHVVVPNGVDTTVFHPGGAPAARPAGAPPTVAYVGNLLTVKGADRLPEIFRRIRDLTGPARFVVAGQGELRDTVAARAAGLDVNLLGEVPRHRVAEIFRAADLVVLPSRSEGWPTVVLEAHACGTPILVTDVGGSAEAVADPRFVVAPGPELERRFAERAARVLAGEIVPEGIVERGARHSWTHIAERESAVYAGALRPVPAAERT